MGKKASLNLAMVSILSIFSILSTFLILSTFSIFFVTDLEEGMIEVGPGQMVPFWPQFEAKQVVAKIKNTKEVTAPFTLQTVHSTLLMLGNRYGGLYVDVRTSASETLLTISSYKRGQAPVQIINQTKNQMIQYGEKGKSQFGYGVNFVQY